MKQALEEAAKQNAEIEIKKVQDMNKIIFKYPLKIKSEQIIEMPLGYQILTVQIQGEVPYLWVIVDKNEKQIIDCKIRIVGTGYCFDNHLLDYIGTFQLSSFKISNNYVWHVFRDDSPF